MTGNLQRVIARDYVRACHSPYHPSYRAFIAELGSQFHGLLNSGWTFHLTPDTPYATSGEMFADMEHKRLAVFTGGSVHGDHHPMFNSLLWSPNLQFRAVHDVLGHGATQCPFETTNGEITAYHNHLSWFSDGAIPALFSETIGQLCYHGVYGEFVPVQYAKIIKVRTI